MPMFAPVALYLTWCVAMSLLALAYGGYVGARHAAGRPVGGREWLRNLLALFGVVVSVSFVLVIPWTNLPLPFVLRQFGAAPLFAWVPFLIWYVFDLPNRAVRHLIRRRQAKGPVPHALDGGWPADASFLDEINARRTGLDAATASTAHPRSPALDRVARFQPAEAPPEG